MRVTGASVAFFANAVSAVMRCTFWLSIQHFGMQLAGRVMLVIFLSASAVLCWFDTAVTSEVVLIRRHATKALSCAQLATETYNKLHAARTSTSQLHLVHVQH